MDLYEKEKRIEIIEDQIRQVERDVQFNKWRRSHALQLRVEFESKRKIEELKRQIYAIEAA